jgi:hypothetical protein
VEGGTDEEMAHMGSIDGRNRSQDVVIFDHGPNDISMAEEGEFTPQARLPCTGDSRNHADLDPGDLEKGDRDWYISTQSSSVNIEVEPSRTLDVIDIPAFRQACYTGWATNDQSTMTVFTNVLVRVCMGYLVALGQKLPPRQNFPPGANGLSAVQRNIVELATTAEEDQLDSFKGKLLALPDPERMTTDGRGCKLSGDWRQHTTLVTERNIRRNNAD